MRPFVLFFFLSFIVCGCARQTPKKNLVVWTISLRPLFTNYMKDIIAQWEARHPGIQVEWEDIPFDAIREKLIVSLASGHPPSVVNLNTDIANQFSQMGVLLNLDKTISPQIRDEYFQGFWNTYAIPWYVSTEELMYNADLFQKAGLNPNDPPKTWQALIDDAKIIKKKTGNYGWFPAIKFLDDLQEQGIPVVTRDGTTALFDNPRAVAWLSMYVKLFQEGYIPRETIALSKAYQQAVDLYQSGRLGILITGPQFLNRVRDNAPSVYRVTRVAPLPVGPGHVIGAGVMNFAVPKNASLKQAAVDFALFLTNSQNQLRFCEMVPVFPSIKKAAQNSFFESPNGDPQMAMARKIGVIQLQYARDLTLNLPNEQDRNEAIQDAVESALLGEKSPQEALQDAAKLWDRLLQ
jgi:putative chitobiose transport system substrate-binding protein